MDDKVIKPIGKVLERAGLISDVQIRTALKIQSQGDRVKFGEILVSQGILQQETVDFFAEELPKCLHRTKTQPLGYYLQAAALINAQQIKTLLEEQKQKKMLLGELAVEKGWLKLQTLNFFLEYLGLTEQQQQFLSPSHQKIIKSFSLDTKVGSPYALLKEIFKWTEGHPLLTRQLCQVIANANYFIPSGMEAILVEKLVQKYVIQNWENQVLGEYLKTIQEHLLNNTNCPPRALLGLYLKIWQQQEVSTAPNSLKAELIRLGLVTERENKLKVSNRIYRSIFNPDWVKKQLLSLAKKSPTKPSQARKTPPINRQTATVTQIKNEPLTHIAALISVLGLLLISPLVIFLNNSQYKLSEERDSLDPQLLSRSTFCIESIPTEKTVREDWRIILEREKQRLQKQFPEPCQNNLDKLIVLNALSLGKENRVLDGIQSLCQISNASKSFNQAQFWLNRWYNSVHWGEQTKSYLNSINHCPAANKLSRKF